MPASVTISAWPFDAGAGKSVDETKWRKMAERWRSQGILPVYGVSQAEDVDSEFKVTVASGMTVNIAAGQGWARGVYFETTATQQLTLSTGNALNPRIDRIVIRVDLGANTAQLMVLEGTPNVSPTPPAVTRNSTVWDIYLAQVYVAQGAVSLQASNITDEREPSTACGFTIASKVTRATAYSVPNATDTAFPWDTNIYDNCGCWNGGYKLTAPRDGFYLIHLAISWAANTTGTRIQRVRRNGTQYILEDQFQPAASATNTRSSATVARLNKGDYIEALVYQSSGGTLAANSFQPNDTTAPIFGFIYLGF